MDRKSGRKSSPSRLISFGWGFFQDWAIECEDEGRMEDPKVINALFGKYSSYMRRKGANEDEDEDTWAFLTFPNHLCQSFTRQGPLLTGGLGNQTIPSPTDVETFEWCDWWRYQLRRSADIGFALFILFLVCFKESCQAVLEKYPKPPTYIAEVAVRQRNAFPESLFIFFSSTFSCCNKRTQHHHLHPPIRLGLEKRIFQ